MKKFFGEIHERQGRKNDFHETKSQANLEFALGI